jgi:hypothetical protein
MIEVALALVAILIAGLARSTDGAGSSSASIVYPGTCALAAYCGFGIDWWAVAFAVVSGAVLWLGFTKWEDRTFMAVRYGLGPCALALVYDLMTWQLHPRVLAWAVGCAAVGAMYQTMKDVCADLPIRAAISDRIPEFIAGAWIIGAVALA